MPQLADVDSAAGYQIGDYLLLRIAGTKPSPCYVVAIGLAPIDIHPPEYEATWAPDPLAICTQVVVPYEVTQAFHVGARVEEEVTLHAEGGAIQVRVETLLPSEPGRVMSTAPVLAADILHPPSEAVGYSESYDLGEAIRNAIEQLPARDHGIPDWLSRYTIVEIGVEVGGIAGFNHLFARVRG